MAKLRHSKFWVGDKVRLTLRTPLLVELGRSRPRTIVAVRYDARKQCSFYQLGSNGRGVFTGDGNPQAGFKLYEFRSYQLMLYVPRSYHFKRPYRKRDDKMGCLKSCRQTEERKTSSEETKSKISLTNKGKLPRRGFNLDDYLWELRKANYIDKIRLASIGRHHTKKTKAKISLTHKGKVVSKVTKERQSNIAKLHWQDPEYRDKVVRATILASFRRPNQAELQLLTLLDVNYAGEWAYVGDGQLIIGGKNPDFTNTNGKKLLIEMWGDYWHKGEDPQDRIELFRQYGYGTLIIWERELKDTDAILSRLDHFVGGYIGRISRER